MENESPFFIMRDFTIEVILAETQKNVSDYATFDEYNTDYLAMSEEKRVEQLKKDIFQNIQSFFHSFSTFPFTGSFMANDMNIPVILTATYIDGLENHMIFMCHINEENDNRHYAHRHQN